MKPQPPQHAVLNFIHPLARNLKGCWLFNEGRGHKLFGTDGFVHDYSGNQAHIGLGDFQHNPWVHEEWGYSFVFNPNPHPKWGEEQWGTSHWTVSGADTSVPLMVGDIHEYTNNFTVACYYFRLEEDRNQRVIDRILNRFPLSPIPNYSLIHNSSNQTHFFMGNVLLSNGVIEAPLNEWIATVATLSDTSSHLYINGEEVDSNGGAQATPTPGASLVFGGSYNEGEDVVGDIFSGKLGLIAIWDRPLLQHEVQKFPFGLFDAFDYCIIPAFLSGDTEGLAGLPKQLFSYRQRRVGVI